MSRINIHVPICLTWVDMVCTRKSNKMSSSKVDFIYMLSPTITLESECPVQVRPRCWYYYILVVKIQNSTYYSAPSLSFPQVRSQFVHVFTQNTRPLLQWLHDGPRAVTCPPRTPLDCPSATQPSLQTSASLCDTGLHPGSTRCSESNLEDV